MPRTSSRPKLASFNFRVDPGLKAAFTTAAEAEDKPAGQILRDFMRAYVERHRRADLAREARRQSRLVAASPDEAEVMRWIADVSDAEGWR